MLLYKYLSPERIDVLEKLKIRFTQPGDFNDPYEGKPAISGLCSPEDLEEYFQSDQKILELVKEQMPLAEQLTDKQILSLVKPKLDEIKSEVKSQIARFNSDSLKKPLEKINLMGVLSLSEDWDNQLMWAHYAASSKGFVIAFDSEHPFFNQKKITNDWLRHLRKVDYLEQRRTTTLRELSPEQLIYTKSVDWSYEKEWRMALSLVDRSPDFGADLEYPIHLFPFPSDAIKSIILGSSMSERNTEVIKTLIANNPDMLHIELFTAYQSNDSFNLNIKPSPLHPAL